MKKFTLFTFIAVSAMALVGCETTGNMNTNVRTNAALNANSNVAVVVNNNSSAVNAVANGGNRYNSNITREEYDKDKDRYSKEAKDAGSTVGTGVNDGWLWTKAKAALATTDDLRDSTINVDVSNSVVTLRGTVASKAESDKAATVAKGIEGVTSVKNDLKVQANDSLTNQVVGTNANTATNANAKSNANKY